MEQEISYRLVHLARTLRQLEATLAWRELQISEQRVPFETTFQVHSDTTGELRSLVGSCINQAMLARKQIEAMLGSDRAKELAHLERLWQRFRKLNVRVAKAL